MNAFTLMQWKVGMLLNWGKIRQAIHGWKTLQITLIIQHVRVDESSP